jgi:hypothetical protein
VVIPEPWKQIFPPQICQVLLLVADRGFPSAALFALWRQGGTDCSVRLRLSDWVTVAGVSTTVAAHLEAGRLRVGQRTRATLGRGRPAQPWVPGWIVVSAALVVPPKHTQNPGTARERAKRAKAPARFCRKVAFSRVCESVSH